MARSIDTIQQQIIDSLVSEMTAIGVTIDTTKWSKRNIMRLWTYVVAVAIAFLEQLMDVFKAELEATAAKAVPGNAAWVQDKIFKFQYDAVTPQVVQLINLVPQYPLVDATKCIISRCSVKTDLSGNVLIKVATGNPPAALSAGQTAAAQAYINTIGTAGVYYVVTSNEADKLYINADIYFQGQYSSVIAVNVQNAIIAYLASLPFDGVVKISDLENAIKAVDGVNDVIFKNIRARKDSDVYASGANLVLNNQTISRLWNTVAGYIVPETTTGHQLTDSLNFIAE